MNVISRRSAALAVAVSVSVLGSASACGGGSSPATASATTPATATTAAAATASSAAAAGGQFCAVVKQQKAALQGTAMPGLLASGTPAAWKAYLDETATMNRELVDAAPPEVVASVQSLQAATVELKTALEAADYDVSKVGSAKLVKLLKTPERQRAITDLVAYVKTTCSIDLTKV